MANVFKEWVTLVTALISGPFGSADSKEPESESAPASNLQRPFLIPGTITAEQDRPTPVLHKPAVHSIAPDHMVGKRIGHYRITEQIGRGGMGSVYLAGRADHEFQIEVAIKVVSRGMDSRLVLDRFRTERQILATLEHPNIARLLDGGTTDRGLPYFVMEYIRGQSLTEYCDAHQLSVSDRLRLFCKVCDAVSYAHQNLIVHRDLKPDNVLVTEEGIPKLLDFGIAKILEPPTAGDENQPTMTVVRMGTPAYSSPEQLCGGNIGIATDIYSLGVILYELLTGKRPYRLDSLSWDESAKVICGREVSRPSAAVSSKMDAGRTTEQVSRLRKTTIDGLRKRLSGDLDNILAVALRKEPARRYRSVDHFSEEIRRHLEGKPVMSRGDSVVYKSRKFIARHKVATATVLAFVILLCGASVVTAMQAARLSRRLDEDRKLASSFLAVIHDEIARLPGSTPAREALLSKSVEYLNGLAKESGDNRELRRSLALAYERFADLLAGVDGAGLGKSTQALTTFEKARAMREALVREAPSDRTAQYELASNYLMGSYITGRVRSVEQRLEYDRMALKISESLAAASPSDRSYQALLAKAYTSAAYGYGLYDRWEEAVEYFRKAVVIRQRIAAEEPGSRQAQRELANIHYRIGVIETQAGRPRYALGDLEQALKIQMQLAETEENDARVRSDMAATHHFLGVALGQTGDSRAALAHFDEAISIRERTLVSDSRDVRSRSLLAGNYAEKSTVLLHSGKTSDALQAILHSVDIERQLTALDPGAVPIRLSLADYHGRLAAVYSQLSHWRNASENWAAAVTIYDQLDKEGHLRAPDVRKDAEKARAEATRCLALAK